VADIDRDRLIDDLETLVRIESITGSEENIADWAAGALLELGLRVEVADRISSACATIRRGRARRWNGRRSRSSSGEREAPMDAD
jgi:acetylornithine deacetylase/succinyl-diaminopimelate desuccinylase-like protein